MKDTVQKRIYKCKCGTLIEDYVWSSSINEHTINCSKCNKSITYDNLVVNKVAQSAAIRTPTKNR
jgi:hypothetical protein